MPIKRWNGTSWVTVAGDAAPGSAGIVTSATAPSDTTVLWADTTVSSNNALIPAGGTTNQVLSKSSATDYATTWSTPVDATKVPLSTVTAAGDLIVGSGSGAVTNLAAGTSGQVLTANGAGVAPSYQAIPSTSAMTHIQTINVSGGYSWTFSSIPQTYKSLYIVGRNLNQNTSSTTTTSLNFIPGGWATGTNSGYYLEYGASSATATGYGAGATNGTSTYPNSAGTQTRGNSAGFNVNFEIRIPEYTDTDSSGTLRRMFHCITYSVFSTSIFNGWAYWNRNGALSSFTIAEAGGNTFTWASGSISLYGIS